jgi:heat shock protein HtpX
LRASENGAYVMRRTACGRDFVLSARMGVTSLLLVALYLAALVPPIWLFHRGILGAKFAFGFDALVLVLLVCQYVSLEKMALRSSGARIVESGDAPKLHTVLERLAALADVPKPRAAVVDCELPNAFAAGTSPTHSTIVVTRGLVERLAPEEIEAVLAHEISHIANRDGAVMTFASFPVVTLREAIASAPWKMWVFGFPVMVLACGYYVLGLGIMLSISRCREYTADRGAALLTGTPEQLMSALQKIAGSIGGIPARDLRAVSQMSALFILPTKLDSLTHPPVERRLARLAAMSRDLGKAVPPSREEGRWSNLVSAVGVFLLVLSLIVIIGLVVLR